MRVTTSDVQEVGLWGGLFRTWEGVYGGGRLWTTRVRAPPESSLKVVTRHHSAAKVCNN